MTQQTNFTRKLPSFIAVEGPIGVGKTSLTKRLADTFNYEILLDKLKEASLTKIEGRLKAFFKNKCSILNTNEIPITHQVIANEFGTTRVVISRVLKKMEQEKVLSKDDISAEGEATMSKFTGTSEPKDD